MGKKLLSICFVAAVLLMSASLALGMLFAGPAKAGANEVLAAAPSLRDNQGKLNGKVLSQTAEWFADRFFLRQELISANNYLSAHVFGTSDASDVLLGAEGWLYYGQTLADYTGTAPMTDREIFSAAKNLLLMQEYCAEGDRQFLFMIAPNKNSLYPEHMPDYPAVELRNAQRLFARLDAMDVKYLDLFTAFAGEQETLYFAHDSHWNAKGAALGADLICRAFGKTGDYYGADFSGTEVHAGDLYEMLYPALRDTETAPVYGGEFTYEFGSGGTKPDSITINTVSPREGSLLAYRDSFGNSLYPYLADSFGRARFSRSVNYDLTQDGEFVLIELVERNLRYLITNVPVMEAPLRQIALPAESAGTGAVPTYSTTGPEGMMLARGVLPRQTDADSPVYLVCEGRVYEAFCLGENGYAAYVPAEAAAIVCVIGGETLMFAI